MMIQSELKTLIPGKKPESQKEREVKKSSLKIVTRC